MGLLPTAGWPLVVNAQAGTTNHPPEVFIVWPRWGDMVSLSLIKLKADSSDEDGSIAQVQFFVETNLVGIVTNAPFNFLWEAGNGVPIDERGYWTLKAVAIDNCGAKTESRLVRLYYCVGCPPFPVLQIVSPSNAALFAAPATFAFSAEVLASLWDTGPVEFFVGTNSVGIDTNRTILSAMTPASSITVSNLPEGTHNLTVRYLGANGNYCSCTNTIRVVKLGAQQPSLTPDGRIQFDVVTSFSGIQTIVQASSNFGDWIPVSTNTPSSNSFTFTEATPATNAQRFYRVFLPPH